MRTRFYKAAEPSRKTQPISRKRERVSLTKEARAAITSRQRVASVLYKGDIDEAWSQINEATATIAATHHKSVHRVQQELHMGNAVAHTKRSKTSTWNAFLWKITSSREKNDGNSK